METLDALDDRIAHAGHARPPGRQLPRLGGGTLAESVRPDSTTAMASNCPGAAAAPDPLLVPPILAAWLSVFRPCFTAPVWNRILVMVAGLNNRAGPWQAYRHPGAAGHGSRG